jgi:hypothetical protein
MPSASEGWRIIANAHIPQRLCLTRGNTISFTSTVRFKDSNLTVFLRYLL